LIDVGLVVGSCCWVIDVLMSTCDVFVCFYVMFLFAFMKFYLFLFKK